MTTNKEIIEDFNKRINYIGRNVEILFKTKKMKLKNKTYRKFHELIFKSEMRIFEKEPTFKDILKSKHHYYGKTEASYEFAAQAYAAQWIIWYRENSITIERVLKALWESKKNKDYWITAMSDGIRREWNIIGPDQPDPEDIEWDYGRPK